MTVLAYDPYVRPERFDELGVERSSAARCLEGPAYQSLDLVVGDLDAVDSHALGERFEPLGHGYKELEIPPASDGGFSIEPNALHIWPRGRYMCIALPNDERTFTVTLFLPNKGDPSFATVSTGDDAIALFQRDFADALPGGPTYAYQVERAVFEVTAK